MVTNHTMVYEKSFGMDNAWIGISIANRDDGVRLTLIHAYNILRLHPDFDGSYIYLIISSHY